MRRAGRAGFVFVVVVILAVAASRQYPYGPANTAGLREGVAGATGTSARWDLALPGHAYSYNFDLMARVISAEAKGEPYVGQVAVGAVILNRLDHPHFPKTIPGVIFEPDAFTAVSTGHIWELPAASSARAAQDALAGWDPSGGAVYYYNPAKATNWWVAGRRFLVQIGRHIFLR